MNTRKKLIGLLAGRAKAVAAILLAASVGVACLALSPTKAMAGDSGGEPETVDIPVMATWDDNDNQYNNRPGSVEYTLFANGELVEKKTALKEDEYSASFVGKPRNDVQGNAIEYSVTAAGALCYSPTDGNDPTFPAGGPLVFDGTNPIRFLYVPRSPSVWAVLFWDDKRQEDKRPQEVELDIYDGDTYLTSVTLTKDDDLGETSEDMPYWQHMIELPGGPYRNGALPQFRFLLCGENGYVMSPAEVRQVKAIYVHATMTPAPEPELPAPEPELPTPELEPTPEPTPEPAPVSEAPQLAAAPVPTPVPEKTVAANPKSPLIQTGDVIAPPAVISSIAVASLLLVAFFRMRQ